MDIGTVRRIVMVVALLSCTITLVAAEPDLGSGAKAPVGPDGTGDVADVPVRPTPPSTPGPGAATMGGAPESRGLGGQMPGPVDEPPPAGTPAP